MWIRLLQSHVLPTGKKVFMGQNLNVTLEYGQPLIDSGKAELWDGNKWEKMKTDLFKQK